MTIPTTGELRTKVLFYTNTPTAVTGGDVTVSLTLYSTAWGRLQANDMGEGFQGGIDTTQTYDLWVRYDSSYPLIKPLTAYANGRYFNVNSIAEIWQARMRWVRLSLTIDRYAEIAMGTTTTTTL